MKNVMTPSITLAIVLLAAMAAVGLRAAARRPEPRWAPGGESAPITVRTPGSPAGHASVLSRCRTYFTSCTPMSAMRLARSATASTGRRNASSELQPEPLILGLVPDQPAPGAVTDRVHKAIYCRGRPLSCHSPVASPGARVARAADAGGQMSQTLPSASVNPRLRQTSSGRAASQAGGRHGCAAFSVAESGATRTHSASALTCVPK